MTLVISRNMQEPGEQGFAPLHEDGTGYAYCLYFNDNSEIAFADTLTELVSALIPGYANLTETDRDVERIRYAQTAAAEVQAEILLHIDESDVTPEQWAALTSPRFLPQPRADWWTTDVPLVVVETGYAPYTETPRPASALQDGIEEDNPIWFINPAEEETLLDTLHSVGYLQFLSNDSVDN